MTKRCFYCSKVKDIKDFWKNNTKKDKVQTCCKDCQHDLAHKYYKKHKKEHAKVTKKLKLAKVIFLKQILKDYLGRHHCVDCGERDPEVLEFDHVDKEKKLRSVSSMLQNAIPWENILKEIEKCVVRCANCHRKRTLRQFGWKRV